MAFTTEIQPIGSCECRVIGTVWQVAVQAISAVEGSMHELRVELSLLFLVATEAHGRGVGGEQVVSDIPMGRVTGSAVRAERLVHVRLAQLILNIVTTGAEFASRCPEQVQLG